MRQMLANRMAEVQASPVHPDASKETKVDTGYGVVRLIQKTVPEELEDPDNTIIDGISRVTLTAEWSRGGVKQSKQLVFYVYRAGYRQRPARLSPSSRSRSRSRFSGMMALAIYRFVSANLVAVPAVHGS